MARERGKREQRAWPCHLSLEPPGKADRTLDLGKPGFSYRPALMGCD